MSASTPPSVQRPSRSMLRRVSGPDCSPRSSAVRSPSTGLSAASAAASSLATSVFVSRFYSTTPAKHHSASLHRAPARHLGGAEAALRRQQGRGRRLARARQRERRARDRRLVGASLRIRFVTARHRETTISIGSACSTAVGAVGTSGRRSAAVERREESMLVSVSVERGGAWEREADRA